jgi:integrase
VAVRPATVVASGSGPWRLAVGDIEGHHRNPEHVSRQFTRDVERCGRVPRIRLHDLRHTHATLLLLAREPVHVVSQRLGHASPMVTMTVYAHVLPPGNQRDAADTFARLPHP